MEARKVYVSVEAVFNADGNVLPQVIHWEDGMKFPVDRVLDIRRAASLKAGGTGIRYTIRIGRNQTFLWREEDRWFVEAKYKS